MLHTDQQIHGAGRPFVETFALGAAVVDIGLFIIPSRMLAKPSVTVSPR